MVGEARIADARDLGMFREVTGDGESALALAPDTEHDRAHAVRKSAFHAHFSDQRRHAFHAIVIAQHLPANFQSFSDGPSVTNEFEDLCRKQGHGFRMVQP